SNDGNSLTHNLLNTINVLNNESLGDESLSHQSYDSSYSCDNVLKALRAHKWTIRNEEQDAFELFNVLTDTLESELYSSFPVYSLKDALIAEGLMNESSPETSPAIQTRASHMNVCGDNRIVKPLPTKGMLCSQLYCRKCSHKFPLHLDTFDTISLSIPNNVFGIPIELHKCLEKFVSNEIIHEVRCETCIKNSHQLDANRKSAFVKKLTFAKMPQLLCLQIHRLVWLNDGQIMKRNEHIIFPEYLDMDSYVYKSNKSTIDTHVLPTQFGLIGGASTSLDILNPSPNPIPNLNVNVNREPQLSVNRTANKYKYKLCSVIVHLGGASSGHFICYRRGTDDNNSQKWYYISDTDVLEVRLSKVLESPAYMLFYERVSK
ncbi:unnamed protein product, partial [Medioppia subpectinata]